MNRRSFLLKTTPFVAAGLAVGAAVPSSVSAAGIPLPKMKEGTEGVRMYDTEIVNYTMKSRPVMVVIDDGSPLSENKFESIAEAFETDPQAKMPVYALPAEKMEYYPEVQEWNAVPGGLIVLRDGFVEANRFDMMSASDVLFLVGAVTMDEEGKG